VIPHLVGQKSHATFGDIQMGVIAEYFVTSREGVDHACLHGRNLCGVEDATFSVETVQEPAECSVDRMIAPERQE
jgi:hypothetical protein